MQIVLPITGSLILGPMADVNLRRALTISEGSIVPLLERPICWIFLIMILGLILSQTGLFKKKTAQ